MNRSEIEAGYRHIRAEMAGAVEDMDGTSRFETEVWKRPAGGGGESWTLSGDGPIERAAANWSAVFGAAPEGREELGDEFYATGVSIIVHPRDPHAPTFHANLRYIESDDSGWFGGGADLTPYYLFEDDARHFHSVLRQVCHRHQVADHSGWKTECDRYFYLPHRREARGIGGIFFDHLTEPAMWDLQQDLGAALVDAYLPILETRIGSPHGHEERAWHELRRGRYVEFNLVWDRGTRFGLETGGRTASILASLPPRARWDESFTPAPGSPEVELLTLLQGDPRPW